MAMNRSAPGSAATRRIARSSGPSPHVGSRCGKNASEPIDSPRASVWSVQVSVVVGLQLPLGGQPVRFRVAGVQADRCVYRPPPWPDGRPPHPPRDLLRAGAQRPAHIARFESGRASNGHFWHTSVTSTTAPMSAWNCSSVPGSRIWSVRGGSDRDAEHV
jgi:hypothetical protein